MRKQRNKYEQLYVQNIEYTPPEIEHSKQMKMVHEV